MKDWSDIKIKEQLRKRYSSYLPALMEVAQKCGYALAVHGSMTRDLDLIAVPWVKKAYSPESLVIMLQEAMTGQRNSRKYWKEHANKDPKPHRRKAYIIPIATLHDKFEGKSLGSQQRHAFIDLSVMPAIVKEEKI